MARNGVNVEEGSDGGEGLSVLQSLFGSSDAEVEENSQGNEKPMVELKPTVERQQLLDPPDVNHLNQQIQQLLVVVGKQAEEIDYLKVEIKRRDEIFRSRRPLLGNSASVNPYGNTSYGSLNYPKNPVRFESSNLTFLRQVQDEGSLLSYGNPLPAPRGSRGRPNRGAIFPENNDPRGAELVDMMQRKMRKSISHRSYGNPSRQNEVKRKPNQKGVTDEAKLLLLALPDMTEASLSVFYLARVVPTDEPAYADILEYIKNSQEHNFGVKLVKLIRIVRKDVKEFEHDSLFRDRFRMMLWHGTKKANVASILTNGLKPPPPKQQMAGPGIYFADRISKSCQYCDGTTPGTTGYLFLCDVFLGQMFYTAKPHPELTEVPKVSTNEKSSIYYAGKKVPDRSGNKLLNGSILPCGPTIDNQNPKLKAGSVIFNEYIKYDPCEIRDMYLAQVEFTTTKVT